MFSKVCLYLYIYKKATVVTFLPVFGIKIHPSFWSFCRASNSLQTSHSPIYIKLKQVWNHNERETILEQWGCPATNLHLLTIFTLSHTQANYSNTKHTDCCKYALHICSGPSIDILNTVNNNNDTLSTLSACFLMTITSLIHT